MEKKLEVEQVVAMAFLNGFEFVSGLDVSLFLNVFLSNNPDFGLGDTSFRHIKNYVERKNNKIYLKDGIRLGTHIPELGQSLSEYFTSLISEEVKEKFSFGDFLLMKIKYLQDNKMRIENFLDESQKNILDYYQYKGHLLVKKDGLGHYQNVSFFNIAKLRLFKLENPMLVEKFQKEVKELGYSADKIDEYFLSLKLDGTNPDIWNVSAFVQYFGKDKNLFRKIELNEKNMRGLIDRAVNLSGEQNRLYICCLRNNDIDYSNLVLNDPQKVLLENDFLSFSLSNIMDAREFLYGYLNNQGDSSYDLILIEGEVLNSKTTFNFKGSIRRSEQEFYMCNDRSTKKNSLVRKSVRL